MVNGAERFELLDGSFGVLRKDEDIPVVEPHLVGWDEGRCLGSEE